MRQFEPRLALAGICLTALIAGGCGNSDGIAASAEDASEAGGDVVDTVAVTRADLTRTTTQPATVHAYFDARVYAKVSGYLKELRVDIGQAVEEGDVLAVVDVPEMVKQCERQQRVITRLEAEERRAQAEVELARANLTSAEALEDQADADIEKAVAQLAADQAEFNRVEDLVQSRAVEGRLLDEARARLDAAKAARSAAEAALASAEANVLVYRARIAAAEADQATAEAETDVARKQLEELDELLQYATLTAPFAGNVVQRGVEVGDLVRNTQTAGDSREPLFTIARIDQVRVRIAVPEDDAPWADPGDPVAVRLTAMGNQPIQSEITRVARALDPSTRTMLVEVDVPNPELRLLPGLYGEATISLEAVEGALVLPSGAVRYSEAGESYVYTVPEAGTVQIVNVETGLDDGHQIQITSGLSEGARVVAAMIGRLEEGQKVHVR
jgi:RND family efflux transporter MFP subunit